MNENCNFLIKTYKWIRENGGMLILGMIVLFFYISSIYAMIFYFFPMLDAWLSPILNYLYYAVLSFILDHPYRLLAVIAIILMIKITAIRKRKKQRTRFPIIGLPDEDKIMALFLLFKIRCAEIVEIYFWISEWQKEAKEDESKNWISIFIRHSIENNASLGKFADDGKQNELRAAELTKNKFSFDAAWLADKDYTSAKEDLLVLLSKKCDIDTFRKLKGVRTYGLFDQTISDLMHQYEIFESRSEILFIENKFYYKPFKSKIITAKKNIDQIWEEIILALRASLIYLKTKYENNPSSSKVNIDKLLEEVELFSTLLWALEWGVTKHDFKATFDVSTLKDEGFFGRIESYEEEKRKEEGKKSILDARMKNPIHKIY